MTVLQVTLSRSPRSLIVGDHTITIELARQDTEQPAVSEDTEALQSGTSGNTSGAESAADTCPTDDDAARQVSGLPASVGSVITDVSGKVVTPLAQSNAVPVLAGATHELITAEEAGFGGLSEEELVELKQLLQHTADMVVELQEQHRQSLSELQETAVELAVAAASWLTGVAIDRGQFAVDDLIRRGIQQLDADQPVRVRLNPADHDLLISLMRDSDSRRSLDQVSIVNDETISRGTVRVESGRRILLTDMNSRLDDIRRLWMENLNDSQIERRGDGTASGTLRRFPERRETA